MTEKEKSLSGMIYDASMDNGMHEEIYRTRCLIHRLNAISPEQKEERDRLLHSIIDMAPDGLIVPPFFCDYGFNIHIGKKFFANTNLCILDEAPVTIGDNVFIAPNVGLYTAGHPLDVKRRNEWKEYAYPITIGNNVWIGAQCVILPGVTIGDDTVVAAGSVVNRSLPAGVLAAGNPCRVIRGIDQEAEELREDYRPKW